MSNASQSCHAEAATLDHCRPSHRDVRILGCNHDVAAAEKRRVAGKATPGGDPDQRHQSGELGEILKCTAVEPRDLGAVRVPRPPSASLGKEHHRQAKRLGELEHPVLLVVIHHALRAGKHGVVV